MNTEATPDQDNPLPLLWCQFLAIRDADGTPGPSYNIYRSLIFDVELPGDSAAIYHLCDGHWYKAEKSYIDRLRTYLDKKYEDSNLLPYNHDDRKNGAPVYSEGNYALAIPNWNTEFICLDKSNIRQEEARK